MDKTPQPFSYSEDSRNSENFKLPRPKSMAPEPTPNFTFARDSSSSDESDEVDEPVRYVQPVFQPRPKIEEVDSKPKEEVARVPPPPKAPEPKPIPVPPPVVVPPAPIINEHRPVTRHEPIHKPLQTARNEMPRPFAFTGESIMEAKKSLRKVEEKKRQPLSHFDENRNRRVSREEKPEVSKMEQNGFDPKNFQKGNIKAEPKNPRPISYLPFNPNPPAPQRKPYGKPILAASPPVVKQDKFYY